MIIEVEEGEQAVRVILNAPKGLEFKSFWKDTRHYAPHGMRAHTTILFTTATTTATATATVTATATAIASMTDYVVVIVIVVIIVYDINVILIYFMIVISSVIIILTLVIAITILTNIARTRLERTEIFIF